MKTDLFGSITTLALCLMTFSCGQLPPSKMNDIDRRRIESERNNPSLATIKVSSLEFNSVGSVDLHYVATYNSQTQIFVFSVSRANAAPANQLVLLRSNDNPILHDGMLRVFTGLEVLGTQTTCADCNYISDATVTPINTAVAASPANQYHFPVLTTPLSGSTNMMNQITLFVLEHL